MTRHRLPRFYAAPHSGTRYHRTPACTGLNSYVVSTCNLRDAPAVTVSAIRRRNLQPCRICNPAPVAHLAVVA